MLVIGACIAYLVIMNLFGFISMGVDKKRSLKKQWRIPEINLFLYAILGGSIGSILGMHLFHHKTRHWYFLYGMPFILILQIIIVVLVISSPITLYIQ